MLSALVWKEWRQLATLRRGGALLILVLPWLMLAGAELAQRGLLPLGLAGYSAAEILGDALPLMMGLAVWPALGLMVSAQAMAGDRANGTETFWLLRPVPPGSVWWARFVAAVGSVGWVVLAQTAAWWLLAWISGGLPNGGSVDLGTRFLMGRWLPEMALESLAVGIGLTALASICGFTAASWVERPLQGMLFGTILLALPFALGRLLQGWNPYAEIGVPLGPVFGLLIVPVYLVSSYRSLCHGEPLRQDRLRRGAGTVAIAAVAIALLYLPVAGWAAGASARNGLARLHVAGSVDGGTLLARSGGQGSAWMIDVEDGTVMERLDPWVFDAAWNDEGTVLALLRAPWSGEIQLELRDRDNRPVAGPFDCSCVKLAWVGERVAVASASLGVRLLDPDRGTLEPLEVRPADRVALRPAASGAAYVERVFHDGDRPTTLQRLLDAPPWLGPEVEIPARVYGFEHAFSRSGRYVTTGSGSGGWNVVDLETGESTPAERFDMWLIDDLSAHTGREEGIPTVTVHDVDGAVRTRRKFFDAGFAHAIPSPDGRRLLVWQARVSSEDPDRWESSYEIYDVEQDRWWTWIADVPHSRRGEELSPAWAGPETVALYAGGVLAIAPLEPGAEPRVVVGGGLRR